MASRYEKVGSRKDEVEGLLETTEPVLPAWQRAKGLEFICASCRMFVIVLAAWLPFATGYFGYQYGRESALPQMPTHEITKDAFGLVVKHIDTVLEDPSNMLYTGGPRPEHEKAWNELLRGFNVRVPKKVADQTPFDSYELKDGSGDVWATPYVFHNLHCLKAIRELYYPEHYPLVAEAFKRKPDGNISLHLDHCLDGLRQSVMCQGDLSLVGYGWRPRSDGRPHPMERHFGYPHLCANWQKISDWASARAFDVWDRNIVGSDLIENFKPKLQEIKDNAGKGFDVSPDFAQVEAYLRGGS